MSIIKRKKQDKFFLMSNHATQKDLTSLQSIGLLAYIISLPEDWILYKTQLQSKFTRRTVDSAWKELVEKNYIAGFVCYLGKEKKYFYLASDEALTQSEYDDFITDTLEELKSEDQAISNIKPIPNCDFSTARFVQYKKNSTNCTVQNEHIQRDIPKDIEQRNIEKDIYSVNTRHSHYNNLIESLFLEEGDGLFDHDDIEYFSDKILDEAEEEIKNPEAYFSNVIKTIVYRRKRKLGLLPPVELPIYNWLDN